MKKNVIALAVAAAMAAPLAAQAEVKVSGGLQAEITSLSGDTVTEGLYMHDAQEGGNPGSGNFGFLKFSASEDLGGGMKALAMYNMNIKADTATSGDRDAYVGLTGGFGTVLAGRMSTPYKSSTVKWDPFLATAAQARGNYGMSGLHNSYVSNALAYANKFGAAKVVAAVVFDEAVDDEDQSETSADHAFSVSVNVPVGPVEVAVAHVAMDDYGTNTTTTTTQTVNDNDVTGTPVPVTTTTTTTYAETGDMSATKVGVKFASGAMSVAGQFETIDTGAKDNTDFMYLNGTYTAGANTFAVAYGQVDDGGNETPNYMALGMVHSMSKNVRAHVGYIALDHDNGADDAGIAAGLRVKF